MDVRDRRGLAREVDDPVERRIAAAEDRELLAVVLRGIADAIVDAAVLERLRPRHADAPRLERAHAAGDDHRARVEARAGDGLDVETAIVTLPEADHFLAEMQR